MIFYVGDIHGRVDDVMAIDRAAVEAGVEIVVQVGDFGIRWNKGLEGCPITKYFTDREAGPVWYTCGGNHDNWYEWGRLQAKQAGPGCAIDASKTVELAPGCFYVVRGTVLDLGGKSHIFFGGAESTDKLHRVEGISWWAAETPNREEFETFFDSMVSAQPEVVITHDAPLCVDIFRAGRDTSPTPRNLQNVLEHCDYTPASWYFGHHHMLETWTINGTKFHCCGLHGEYKAGNQG